jgi:hypothetical protein
MEFAICLPAYFLYSTYQRVIEQKYPQTFVDFSRIIFIGGEEKTGILFIAFFVEEIFTYSVLLDIPFGDLLNTLYLSILQRYSPL